jgi:muramoyltetrapeptide carboxypeptidase
MKRQEFLSLVPGIAGLSFAHQHFDEPVPAVKVPPFLKAGDKIAITCPAGWISLEEIQPAIKQMESWGLVVRVGMTVGKRDFSFGGTDEERAKDMQILLDDFSVKAIMCARGGYGINRIIDRLNFARFKEKPKWIIGFSDITALHVHLDKNFHIASIHSKMCNSFPDDFTMAEPIVQDTILSIKRALTGSSMKYTALPQDQNRTGVASGLLVGGNLSIIISMMGTKSEINTDGKILFLEETGEYMYSLDRMLMTLKRAGKLDKIKGLIIGGFRVKPDDPGEEFGRSLYDIVYEKVSEYTYPVCFGFPVGHQKDNYALKHGMKHMLTVRKDGVELVETS